MRLQWLHDEAADDAFPAVDSALREPDGLLCAGGRLTSTRLLAAYRRGIFPWYNEGEPVLWWSPDPRCIFEMDSMKISRRLRARLRRHQFRVSVNTAFAEVVTGCGAPRGYTDSTWITPDMAAAYAQLHREGHAHSIEAWLGDTLCGGLYGVAIGRVFFGESMFSRVSDASKVVLAQLLAHLAANDFELLDCQVASSHLDSLGARLVPRADFCNRIKKATQLHVSPEIWLNGQELNYSF